MPPPSSSSTSSGSVSSTPGAESARRPEQLEQPEQSGRSPSSAADSSSPLSESPTVAVIIPAFNAAKSLEDAVESAIAQDPQVNEIVIAAGDPATSMVAHRLADEAARRLKVVEQRGHGASDSRIGSWDNDDGSELADDHPELADDDPEPAESEDSIGGTGLGSGDGEAGWDRFAESDKPIPVKVVGNPSGGTSSALNAAIAATDAQVLVRLDTHARLPTGYVARAIASLAETGAANVGGRQVPEAPSGFARAVALAMRSPFGTGGATYRSGSEAGPADTVYLGVYRRDAIEQVGGFDDRFVRNQDAELNERLRAAGLVVWFDPALAVTYRPRSNPRALASQYFQYGRWRRATARKHRGSLRLRQVAAPILVIGLIAAVVAAAATGEHWLATAPALAYALGLVVAGLHATRRPLTAIATALALATMHVAWGLGFLVGPGRAVRRSRRTTDR